MTSPSSTAPLALVAACALASCGVNGSSHREAAPVSVRLRRVSGGGAHRLPARTTLPPSPRAWPSTAGWVPPGEFEMGRGETSADRYAGGFPEETPAHRAKLPGFALDLHEVSVGRLRRFARRYRWPPVAAGAGAGAHPERGWRAEWNALLPRTRAALERSLACGEGATYGPPSPKRDAFAVTCASWYVAFALCASEGGRLPTEAEWEYAAAGGDEERLYAWGSRPVDCDHAAPFDDCRGLAAVGALPAGRARWGHDDLSGGVSEWVFDVFAPYDRSTCDGCARADGGPLRVARGGTFWGGEGDYRAVDRQDHDPATRSARRGFRCAYDAAR